MLYSQMEGWYLRFTIQETLMRFLMIWQVEAGVMTASIQIHIFLGKTKNWIHLKKKDMISMAGIGKVHMIQKL